MKKFFVAIWKNFWIWLLYFFIWLLYFFIWLLYEFLGENMLLYYWYLGWNKHFRITFSKHRLPKASTNARVALFKIDLQPRGSNVHIMTDICILFKNHFLTDICRNFAFFDRYMKIFIFPKLAIFDFCSMFRSIKTSYIGQYNNPYIGLYKNVYKTLGVLAYIDLYTPYRFAA